ncbi:hypothetical protein ABZT08_06015 [Streptomyces sp. NPDC005526]|uniref:hypothetical protein n=1 Tax=Streptomyces sp. NPDC005526 TaxID=3156885 RepID=UPI0033B78186
MRGRQHGALGAALALLTLLGALFCATSATAASPDPASVRPGAAPAVTALDHPAPPSHESLSGPDRGAPVFAADAPCLKKAQPGQQQPRVSAPLAHAVPAENSAMADARAPVRVDAPRRTPGEPPPDLAELSVRRV